MYIVTNAAWGDAVEVTVEDVKKQAEIFGVDPSQIEELENGEGRVIVNRAETDNAGRAERIAKWVD